jgi:hypothetical protein
MSEKTLGEIFDAAFSERVHGRIRHFEDLRFDVRVAIEAGAQAVIEAHEARKWQPIESVQTSLNVILKNEVGLFIGCVERPKKSEEYARITSGDFGILEPFPTHWQPLP